MNYSDATLLRPDGQWTYACACGLIMVLPTFKGAALMRRRHVRVHAREP